MANLVIFISGLVFAIGLGISGMTEADKVINFLDVGGAWDPSLAFVMIGAIAVHFVLYKVILKRPSPILAARFGVPSRTDIDARLILGAGLFGVGWALGGYCPGPGLVSSVTGASAALVFVGAMVGGMLLFKWVNSLGRG